MLCMVPQSLPHSLLPVYHGVLLLHLLTTVTLHLTLNQQDWDDCIKISKTMKENQSPSLRLLLPDILLQWQENKLN